MDHRILERNVQNLKNDTASPIEFKNLTNRPVHLYWIDFDDSKLKLYAELSPIGRKDRGLRMKMYTSHPWLAKVEGPNGPHVLLNGKKYFNPPRSNLWMKRVNGWMNEKWNQVKDKGGDHDHNEANGDKAVEVNGEEEGEEDGEKEEHYFEILLLDSGCRSLKESSLLRCCQLYSQSSHLNSLPKRLKTEIELCRKKHFWTEDDD